MKNIISLLVLFTIVILPQNSGVWLLLGDNRCSNAIYSPTIPQTVISYFDGGAGVEWVKTTGDWANDTTFHLYSTKAIRLINEVISVTNIMWQKDTLNMSDSHLSLTFYTADPTQINNIIIYIYSVGGANGYYQIVSNGMRSGWNTVDIPRSTFLNTSGTIDWSKVNRIDVRLTKATGKKADIVLNRLMFVPDLPKGRVVITFDDGSLSTYSIAKPYLDTKGYVASFLPIETLLGGVGYVNLTQVKELHSDGWEIAGHGIFADTLATSDQLEARYDSVKSFLCRNGFSTNGQFSYGYPGGIYNYRVIDVAKKYFTCARTTSAFNQPAHPTGRYRINGISFGGSITVAAMESFIAKADTLGEITVLVFHNIVESGATGTSVNRADFEAVIDYIGTRNVDVMTMSEAIKEE